jgi:zinc protease
MRLHRLLPVLLLLQNHTTAAQVLDIKADFTLKNGMRVVLVEDHTVPSVCFSFVVRAGSRNERPGITGISHLFEHMMFNGSKKYKPLEFDKILEMGGGYSNAGTERDMTFYYEEFNPDLLDKVLDMEADRLRSLKIDADNLEQERGIVKEERRVSTDNNVVSKMFEDLYAGAYFAHTYKNPVVGWMKDLDAITLQDAREYFTTYYAPNNISVFVVGDFTARELQPKIERMLGSLPRQSGPREVVDAEPVQQGERRLKLHKAAELPAVAIGYKSVAATSPDFYPLGLLATILARGQSSRLYKRLVYDREIAADVSAGVDENLDPGLFWFYVQMQKGEETQEAEHDIYALVDEIATDGVTEQELQKAKNTAQADYVDAFKTNMGVASRLANFEVVQGDYKKALGVLDRYNAVTRDDVKRVAAQYLTEQTRTVVVLVPQKGQPDDSAR